MTRTGWLTAFLTGIVVATLYFILAAYASRWPSQGQIEAAMNLHRGDMLPANYIPMIAGRNYRAIYDSIEVRQDGRVGIWLKLKD